MKTIQHVLGRLADSVVFCCLRPPASNTITKQGACSLQQNNSGQRWLVKKSWQMVKTILLERGGRRSQSGSEHSE